MRVLLLLVLIGTSLWCEDYQKLTFSDGKVLTGYFDERKGTITLDDGKTIAVKVDDIVRRESAVRDQKKLDIPPPVKSPGEETPQPKTSSLPAAAPTDLLPPVEALAQARRRWIAVLRETNTYRHGVPDEVFQRAAQAKADLEMAMTVMQQSNGSLHAELAGTR